VICTFGDFHFTTQNFWGFPLYHPALIGISTLPPSTMVIIPTLPSAE